MNFGRIDRLEVRGPIQTFGTGARGFNLYEGSLRHASFAEIATLRGVSERTTQRDWAKARALLYTFLGGKDLSV